MGGCHVKRGVTNQILIIDVSFIANEQLGMLNMTILAGLQRINTSLHFLHPPL